MTVRAHKKTRGVDERGWNVAAPEPLLTRSSPKPAGPPPRQGKVSFSRASASGVSWTGAFGMAGRFGPLDRRESVTLTNGNDVHDIERRAVTVDGEASVRVLVLGGSCASWGSRD